MTERERVSLTKLRTGVPGLDEVLGGGLPEYSVTLIGGEPGSGKTTLIHQVLFANATVERPALYFTALGEPPLKMLRYQQQMSFFDPSKVGSALRFVDLSAELIARDLSAVLQRIVRNVREANPALVAVDSFRSIMRASAVGDSDAAQQSFLHRLALQLTTWQTTTLLAGEYTGAESADNPAFTTADGIIWLYQNRERNAVVRKLQVGKLRGEAPVPGLHAVRITSAGLEVFPRTRRRPVGATIVRANRRQGTGTPELDELLHGGIPTGDSVLVAGPAGTGKSVLGAQFVAEGIKAGERGVVVLFEEHPEDYLDRAAALNADLRPAIARGDVALLYESALDLSVDETLQHVRHAVARLGAKRLVLDSLSGFEVAIAPSFREDFQSSLYHMVGALTGEGITVMMTVEVTESFAQLAFSPHAISFLTEDIIMLRYVEIAGELQRLLAVIKMRRSPHVHELRRYEITPDGIALRERLNQYIGVLTGVPRRRRVAPRPTYPGLTADERAVLSRLATLDRATEDALAAATALDGAAVASALRRLVALNYVIAASEQGATVYRTVARPL